MLKRYFLPAAAVCALGCDGIGGTSPPFAEIGTPDGHGSPSSDIVVVEAFWYGCPHCYEIEPQIQRWTGSFAADTTFVRLPVTWNEIARLHARGYYAAVLLGVADRAHPEMFREIHVRNARVDDEAALVELFGRFGVTESAALAALHSAEVDERLSRADELMRSYEIEVVPSLVVNGRFRSDTRMAGGQKDLIQVMDRLIGHVRSGQ